MGSPEKIKVDTEQLRVLSKGYVARSGVINDTWNSTKLTLDGIVRRMPAYDGRLQKAANQDVLDFTTRSREFFGFFQDDAASLIKIAEDFEYVDGQTIKIIQDADDLTRASLIDSGAALGENTTVSTEVAKSPDGSFTIKKIVIRTINPDGTVTIKTIIQTIQTVDAATAENWNRTESYMASTLLDANITLIGGIVGGAPGAIGGFVASRLIDYITTFNPTRSWQAGDTITTTTTYETSELLDAPDEINPLMTGPTTSPDAIIETVIEDAAGNVVLEEKYRIDYRSGARYRLP